MISFAFGVLPVVLIASVGAFASISFSNLCPMQSGRSVKQEPTEVIQTALC